MSYNTPADLRLVLEVPGDVSDPTLQVFLEDANLLVVELLTGKGLSPARMKVIERYLAAHFAVLLVERGGITASQVGNSQDNYLNISRMASSANDVMGFKLTRWGQQAVAFDTTGTLQDASKSTLPALFKVLGRGQWPNCSVTWP